MWWWCSSSSSSSSGTILAAGVNSITYVPVAVIGCLYVAYITTHHAPAVSLCYSGCGHLLFGCHRLLIYRCCKQQKAASVWFQHQAETTTAVLYVVHHIYVPVLVIVGVCVHPTLNHFNYPLPLGGEPN